MAKLGRANQHTIKYSSNKETNRYSKKQQGVKTGGYFSEQSVSNSGRFQGI